MFRKTIICVIGIVAGVSAGAYSSGFFNEENVVTSAYNFTMDRLGFGTPVDPSLASDMSRGGGIAPSQNSSIVSTGLTASGADFNSRSAVDASSSNGSSVEEELLATNSVAKPSNIDRLNLEAVIESAKAAAKSLTLNTEETNGQEEADAIALAALVKEAEAAASKAAIKKAELERRRAEVEAQQKQRQAEAARIKVQQARIRAEAVRKKAEADRVRAEKARIQAEIKQAQVLVETRFSKEVYKSATGEKLNYRKLVPSKTKKDTLQPLVIFLHGKGERGNDNQSQLKHGLRLFAADEGMETFPAIVIAPQCPEGQLWATTLQQKDTTPKMDPQPTPSMRLVIELLDLMLLTESVDPDRVYVTGLSMGGFGTFDLVARRPTAFAAAVPLCGGGDPSPAKIRRLLNLPMWVVHGTDDSVINVNRSREMVYALEAAGAAPRYSELTGFDHNIWDATYNDIELYNWMFSQSKAETIDRTPNRSQGRKPFATRNKRNLNDASGSTVAVRSKTGARDRNRVGRRPVTPQIRVSKQPTLATAPQVKPLLGLWKVLAASQKGKQAGKKILNKMSVTFEKDQFVIEVDGRQEVAKFKLTESDKVQEIDIISSRKGVQASAGIYELNGKKLILCWGEPGSPRPTRFVNSANVKSLVLERQ